jgi:two-component system phosphate regulon sensor histidine kinase PhoR
MPFYRHSDTPDMDKRQRGRDFIALIAIGLSVLIILLITGALGGVEMLVASTVFIFAVFAYFIGTSTGGRGPGWSSLSEADGVQIDQNVLDVLPFPALRIDGDGKIAETNALVRDLLKIGYRVLPRATTVIRSPSLLDAMEETEASGKPQIVVLKLGSMGQETWRATVTRIKDEQGLLIIFENLTAIVRATQARSDFLANASHELRTPLTALTGYIETMRGPARDDPESWDRFLEIMYREAERMNRLVSDLLSLSRIEFSEHQSPETVENFQEIAASVVTALTPVAEEKGITLVLEGGGEDLPVTADEDELMQVIENLLSNAFKYTQGGGVVRVSIGRAENWLSARDQATRAWDDSERMSLVSSSAPSEIQRESVWLRVEDDGPGIAREHLPRLGERFYRADASRGGKITGTGLGLAIVKHIMTRHRGGLSVESLPGRGSAFGVWLPLYVPEVEAEGDQQQADQTVTQKEGLPKISEAL